LRDAGDNARVFFSNASAFVIFQSRRVPRSMRHTGCTAVPAERKPAMPADPKQAPQDPKPVPPAAHWPNPAGEYAARSDEQVNSSADEDDASRLERTDPKSLHSAAPGDGTGVTGTVPPA
jgi:hypothetical protein